MENETQIIERPGQEAKAHESHIFNLSIRGLIALIIVCTVCYLALRGIKADEPVYSLAFLVVGFYFGQATKPKTQAQ